MAEVSYLWTTGSAGDGASTYTRADWTIIGQILAACGAYQGVAPDYLENLFPYGAGANVVQIGTGGALVDGKPYYNSSRVNVSIPSAVGVGNSRYDRVVLRCNWTAQTVRITRIAGVDAAAPSLPAITQSSGSVFDLTLCYVLVNTAGQVTIVDQRTIASIGANGIKAGAITSSHLAAGAVNYSTVGAQIVKMKQRVGGDPNDWYVGGTTIYTVGNVKMQTGVYRYTWPGGVNNALVTIPYPEAFSRAPNVVITPRRIAVVQGIYPTAELISIASASFVVQVLWPDARFMASATGTAPGGITQDINWFAIGPE